MVIGCKEYFGQPIACDFYGKLGSKDVAEQVCMERGKPLVTVLSTRFKKFFSGLFNVIDRDDYRRRPPTEREKW